MRWLAIIIAAILLCVLQTTIAPRFAIRGVEPDWILLLVVFLALHVRGVDAILAAWTIGLLVDLQSLHRFGMMALGYSTISLIVFWLRGMMFPRHAGTLCLLVFLAGTLLHGVVGLVWQLTSHVPSDVYQPFVFALSVALYSALWAIPLNGLLLRFLPWLGIGKPTYTHAGLSRANLH